MAGCSQGCGCSVGGAGEVRGANGETNRWVVACQECGVTPRAAGRLGHFNVRVTFMPARPPQHQGTCQASLSISFLQLSTPGLGQVTRPSRTGSRRRRRRHPGLLTLPPSLPDIAPPKRFAFLY